MKNLITSRMLVGISLLWMPLLTGCFDRPLEPVAPSTELQMSIPLVNRTFDLRNLNTRQLQVTSTGSFFFDTTISQSPVTIPEISVTPVGTNARVELGEFQLPGLPTQNVSITSSSLGFPLGGPFPVPAGSVNLPPQSLGDFSSTIEYIHAISGTLTMSVTNNLPISVSFTQDIQLQNNLTSPTDTSVIAGFAFNGVTLNPGQSASRQSSFVGGRYIRAKIRFGSIRMNTGSGNVTFTSSSGLSLGFSSTAITSDSARVVFQDTEVISAADTTFNVDDSILVQAAAFKRGGLQFSFNNQIDADVSAYLKLDNFLSRRTLDTTIFNFIIPAKTSRIYEIAMDTMLIGYNSTGIGTVATFTVGLRTINTQGQRKLVTSSDFFQAGLRSKDNGPWTIQSIRGRITPVYVPIDNRAAGFSLDEASRFDAKLTFDSVRFALNLGITGGFITDYQLSVRAKNNRSGIERTLVVPPPAGQSLRRFNPGQGPISIVLDNNAGLSTFLSSFFPNNPPDSFIVQGQVALNPPDVFPQSSGIQTIYDTSKVYTSIETFFPLKIGIGGNLNNEGGLLVDTVNLEGNQSFPKDFATSIKTGSMFFQINNRLPFKLNFAAYLLGDPVFVGGRWVRDTLVRIIRPGQAIIQGADIDGAGLAVAPRQSIFNVQLSGDELAQMGDATMLWYRAEIVTSSTPGNIPGTQPVAVRQSDYLSVRASANLTYIINKK